MPRAVMEPTAPRRHRRLRSRTALALLVVALAGGAMGEGVAAAVPVLAAPATPAPAPTAAPPSPASPTAAPTAAPSPTATPSPSPSASSSSSGSHGLISEALDGLATWITDAATTATQDLLGALENEVTSPNLSATWFRTLYWGGGSGGTPGAVVIAAWLMLLVVTGSLLVGVIRGDPGGMVRLVAVRLPVAILITAIAAWMVTELLALTDVASGWVVSGAQTELGQWTTHLQSTDTGHDFLSVLACLVLILATLLGYCELLARDAAIYIVVAFIPLIAVLSLWAGSHSALKRAAETVFVLAISKFVLVFVLSIGAGALAASTSMSGFAPLLLGTLIFLIAALAPFAVFRLLPLLETSAVAGLAGGASRFAARWAPRAHGAATDAAVAGLGGLQRGVNALAGSGGGGATALAGGSRGSPATGEDLPLAGAVGDAGGGTGDGEGGTPPPPGEPPEPGPGPLSPTPSPDPPPAPTAPPGTSSAGMPSMSPPSFGPAAEPASGRAATPMAPAGEVPVATSQPASSAPAAPSPLFALPLAPGPEATGSAPPTPAPRAIDRFPSPAPTEPSRTQGDLLQ